MLTYADVYREVGGDEPLLMLTYADACGRMLTYADVYREVGGDEPLLMLTHADEC